MNAKTLLFLALSVWLPATAFAAEAPRVCDDKAQFSHHRLDSDETDNLCRRFAGQVVLVVNTASRCGYTDQYDDLEKLYSRYKDRGLLVVGFPSNDFANQEPGSEKKIKEFCRLTYGVQFPMYGKTQVTGEQMHPFYRALSEAAGGSPRWNFHKYLLDREGRLIGTYPSKVDPLGEVITKAIEAAL
jgi:glutathione peroxidase